MAKVFASHEVEIAPGVSEAVLRAFNEEMARVYKVPGQEVYLLKGDRGERSGKCALLVAFDSEERRERCFPAPDF